MIKMKPLLKESTWVDRKFGEPLPTMEDYMSETYNDEDCGDGHAVVSEADDDKYVSVGWGKYKEKGKEDDKNAPTFTKTDSGKYVKAGDDKKGDKGDNPEKEPADKLGGGDFGRDFEDDPDDIDNLDTALDDDPTRGDPDDAWDDEEGRAKPTGKTDADTDDDEYAISGTDSDDPAGGKGDAWMTGHDDDDVHQKGMAKAKDLAKKGMEKRPGGEQAELDYQKADQMLMKYAGVDIEKAEYWAKKKRQASNAMMGEITIDGKKYKPITENIEPTIFNPQEEIKKVWDKIKTRQFDRKWKKEII